MEKKKIRWIFGALVFLWVNFSGEAQESLVQVVPVSTTAEGITQYSSLFVPVPTKGQSMIRHPVLVLLHSGFFGDQASLNEMATQATALGVIVAVPSYRGEPRWMDGKHSEGRVEFCSGEVDDVQNLLEFLKTRADVDPMRIALLGMSHGSCIALRVAERDPFLRAVAILSGPVEIGLVERHVGTHPIHGLWLEPMILSFVGGTFAERPDSYKARSPLYRASTLTMPLFMAHGTADGVVPPVQACWLAEELARNNHPVEIKEMDPQGRVQKNMENRCSFETPVNGSSKLSKVELWFMQGQGHSYGTAVQQAIQDRALQFVVRELFSP